jgi:hypothetical protein
VSADLSIASTEHDGGVPIEAVSSAQMAHGASDKLRSKALIGLLGVGEDSSLGRALAEGLGGVAELIPTEGAFTSNTAWRWLVRGTALDWVGTSATSAAASQLPDIILDLHGCDVIDEMRTWRIVDVFGNCVLRPFSCLAHSPANPLVTSLFLVETQGSGGDWMLLAEAHVSSRRSSHDLLDVIGRTVVWLVKAGLRHLPSGEKAARPIGPAMQSPRAAEIFLSRVVSALARVRDHAFSEIWAIGKIAEPVEAFLSDRTVDPSPWCEIPSREGFIADPFPWPGHDDAILCEGYSHHTGLGRLEILRPGDNTSHGVTELDLNVRTHLSYPFTYAEGDTVVCLPEMAAERRQAMYILDRDGSARELCAVAEDVAMQDPTLFRHAGLYWIAYVDTALGSHESLCLRYATKLEGPWIEHPLNPVKVDVRSSRPGGTPFWAGETLFRPAQDCSRSYGCALVINRIDACTPHQYEEVPVARLTPDSRGRYPDGLHTFSVTSEGILLDGKRIVFDPVITLLRFRKRVRNAAARFAKLPANRRTAAKSFRGTTEV